MTGWREVNVGIVSKLYAGGHLTRRLVAPLPVLRRATAAGRVRRAASALACVPEAKSPADALPTPGKSIFQWIGRRPRVTEHHHGALPTKPIRFTKRIVAMTGPASVVKRRRETGSFREDRYHRCHGGERDDLRIDRCHISIPPGRPRQLAAQPQGALKLFLRTGPRRLVPLAAQDAANQQCEARPWQEEWKGPMPIHYSMT
jgi:hypothetical protein